jgi:hypothetical protein
VVAAHLQDQLLGIPGLADHFEARLVEKMSHSLSQENRVLGDYDAHAITTLESSLRRAVGQSPA